MIDASLASSVVRTARTTDSCSCSNFSKFPIAPDDFRTLEAKYSESAKGDWEGKSKKIHSARNIFKISFKTGYQNVPPRWVFRPSEDRPE